MGKMGFVFVGGWGRTEERGGNPSRSRVRFGQCIILCELF
jgi:hypothetical protein